jgi:hypothetical protein
MPNLIFLNSIFPIATPTKAARLRYRIVMAVEGVVNKENIKSIKYYLK